MRCLVLDTDAVVHARGLALWPVLECLMRALGDGAFLDHAAFMEMHRSGIGATLDAWQRARLLSAPVDYRRIRGGDELHAKLRRKWRGLSRADAAALVIATDKNDAGVLTCESLLAEAAAANGLIALDLFDLVRLGLRLGCLTEMAARRHCGAWSDRFRAGRPRNYAGDFDRELAVRDATKPLPSL